MDETGEVVVDIEGNIESGKTAQDYENEINNYLVEATQAAAAKNWKKSEATCSCMHSYGAIFGEIACN